MVLKCIALGCTREARPLSNYCASCWTTRMDTSKERLEKSRRMAGTVNMQTALISALLAFMCVLAFLAITAKC